MAWEWTPRAGRLRERSEEFVVYVERPAGALWLGGRFVARRASAGRAGGVRASACVGCQALAGGREWLAGAAGALAWHCTVGGHLAAARRTSRPVPGLSSLRTFLHPNQEHIRLYHPLNCTNTYSILPKPGRQTFPTNS